MNLRNTKCFCKMSNNAAKRLALYKLKKDGEFVDLTVCTDGTQIAVHGIVFANLIKELGLVTSTSDAHRMVKQAAVKVDGERFEDSKKILQKGFSAVIQVGKRKFARVKLISK